jgi:predicted dehydrogenase
VYCAAAIDLQDAEAVALRQRVEEAGIAFMAEFPCRLSPATLRLKELLATRLGAPKLLFCNRRRIHPAKQNHNSRCYRDLVELIDWCRYIVESEPTSLLATTHRAMGRQATGHRSSWQGASWRGGASEQDAAGKQAQGDAAGSEPDAACEQHDYFSMSLDFSPAGAIGTGPMAVISCGDYIPESLQESLAYRRPADLKVVCERGIAFVDLPNTVAWFNEAGQHLETLDHERPVGEQLLIHFHRAVASLILKSSSLADAHRAIMIANQAKLSCETGSRVDC